MTRPLTGEEARALADALRQKVELTEGFHDDDPEWNPYLQVVVDTETVVLGVVPLEAFTDPDNFEALPDSDVAEGPTLDPDLPDDPYLWESGT